MRLSPVALVAASHHFSRGTSSSAAPLHVCIRWQVEGMQVDFAAPRLGGEDGVRQVGRLRCHRALSELARFVVEARANVGAPSTPTADAATKRPLPGDLFPPRFPFGFRAGVMNFSGFAFRTLEHSHDTSSDGAVYHSGRCPSRQKKGSAAQTKSKHRHPHAEPDQVVADCVNEQTSGVPTSYGWTSRGEHTGVQNLPSSCCRKHFHSIERVVLEMKSIQRKLSSTCRWDWRLTRPHADYDRWSPPSATIFTVS